MIDHYAIYEIHTLTDHYGLASGVPKGVKPRYNVSPAQLAPVVVHQDAKTEIEMMQWGLLPSGAKDANSVFRYKTFNVQSEKVFTKPSWNAAVRYQRCIVPANGFYMSGQSEGKNVMRYFSPSTPSLLSLAGIYMTSTMNDGTTIRTYAMLTIEVKDANAPSRRIPIILQPGDEDAWLDATISDASSIVPLMRPYEGDMVTYYDVSSRVTSAKMDNATLIEPA